MITQAYFEGIRQVIVKQIGNANESILVAVAWLTDETIFNELCKKAMEGLDVQLILIKDHINSKKAPFNHNRLNTCGGRVYFIPAQMDGSIMHHKFCVIDNSTVITGSYNWSKKAALNDENIVVTEDAADLGSQFKKEFLSIVSRLPKKKIEELQLDLNELVHRLGIIRSFAALGEDVEILKQIKKLNLFFLPEALTPILDKLREKKYEEALRFVEEYIRNESDIMIFEDPDVFGLRLELKSMTIQLNALENELIESELLVYQFAVRHAKELGAYIIEILELKKKHAKNEKERAEAESDEKTYKQGYESKRNINIPELSKEEKQSLNKMYREASLLCHPDRFANEPPEKQKEAEELFKELTESYRSNNVQSVQNVLENLKKGILTLDPKDSIQKKELMLAQLNSMTLKLNRIVERIKEIKQSASYKTATENENWDEYFAKAKGKLQKQIAVLKGKIENE